MKGKAEVEGPSGIGTEMGKVGGEKKQESPGVDEDGGTQSDKRDNQPEVPEDISTQVGVGGFPFLNNLAVRITVII